MEELALLQLEHGHRNYYYSLVEALALLRIDHRGHGCSQVEVLDLLCVDHGTLCCFLLDAVVLGVGRGGRRQYYTDPPQLRIRLMERSAANIMTA